MRITEGIIANTILSNLQLGQGRLELLQQQSSSGLKISTPGDDPVSAQQVLQLGHIVLAAGKRPRHLDEDAAVLFEPGLERRFVVGGRTHHF